MGNGSQSTNCRVNTRILVSWLVSTPSVDNVWTNISTVPTIADTSPVHLVVWSLYYPQEASMRWPGTSSWTLWRHFSNSMEQGRRWISQLSKSKNESVQTRLWTLQSTGRKWQCSVWSVPNCTAVVVGLGILGLEFQKHIASYPLKLLILLS